jgi:hypothetical protein
MHVDLTVKQPQLSLKQAMTVAFLSYTISDNDFGRLYDPI